MSTRTRKILEAALSIQKNSKDDENDQNIVNISKISDTISLDNTVNIFDNILSPEDLEEIIRTAEVVFEDNFPNSQTCYSGSVVNKEDKRLTVENNLEDDVEKDSLDESLHCNFTKAEDDNEDKQYQSTIDESSQTENSEDGSVEINNDYGTTSGKRKKVHGPNKRTESKKLRMTGNNYLGYRKPKDQKNTFHDTPRDKRILKSRCSCKTSSTTKCYEISDQCREKMFSKFWSDMSWDQRKVYVANTVKVLDRKRPIIEISRRSVTYKYHLVTENCIHLPVCKIMYLNTLCLGEWSVRSWALKGEQGMSSSSAVEVSLRKKRRDVFEEDRNFLKSFLNELNKLPYHYCRKDTDRLYLEQSFQSWNDLYKIYVKRCEDEGKKVLSLKLLAIMAKEMKISLYQPRKDQCNTCFMFKNKNVTQEVYERHISKKKLARSEKEQDKERALKGECHMITMDVQAVKLSPQIPASSLYYKTKLCCHNFTIYNLANKKVICYWFNEMQADGQAATYSSFLVDYLEDEFLKYNTNLPIVIYSDGCTAQNRNSILSNALLHLSEKCKATIIQKFLEKGHTQMECDSVHSAIETRLKNKEIYLPSDYLRITREARKAPPYIAIAKEFDFFKNYGDKSFMKYKSIRPSRSNSGSVVTDIRALKYNDGKICYKVDFNSEFLELPIRPAKINLDTVVFPPLFKCRNPITKTKYDHLQAIKKCLPQDCWQYYDFLPYHTKEKS